MIRNINIIEEQFPMLQRSWQDMSIDISDMFKSFFNNTNHREKSEQGKEIEGPKNIQYVTGPNN